jgi:nicotinate-nucleotide pyrophosphorylase (carboxylating)
VTFEQALAALIPLALDEDLGDAGDVTSRVTVVAAAQIEGRVVAKADGVIAGLPAFAAVYRQIDPALTVTQAVADGDRVVRGTVVCAVSGAARSILTGERTALNFLQRLSGIATLTARFVQAVEGTGAVILDTRKTTPGWRLLEKYAVRMGGGHNHRVGLYDMVLIKDNHITSAGGLAAAVTRARADTGACALPLVVEVETLVQLDEALALRPDRILLDNMSLDTMRVAVRRSAGRVPLEASGNVTLETVRAIAETGVNYISVGALTHSAPAFDLSMRLLPR